MNETVKLYDRLNGDQKNIANIIEAHCAKLLDNNPKFKFFSLHGSTHIKNLIKIADLLIEGGLNITNEESYYLYLSICLHDIGMVTALSSLDHKSIFMGQPQAFDVSNAEKYIRDHHHNLIDKYLDDNFKFISGLNISPSDISIIKNICKAHRKIDLKSENGHTKYIGALLRAIDELDIGPDRAPIGFFMNNYKDMDSTSCWHWFKHAITDRWMYHHNVMYTTVNNSNKVIFKIAVHPSSKSSISYWLRQIQRPIFKVLYDDKASEYIKDRWRVTIDTELGYTISDIGINSEEWRTIEQISLSSGKKIILVIDDEVRKMEDLFVPLLDNYHVMYAPNTKDALTRLEATKIDIAIVDMQISSSGLWPNENTQFCKTTGINICSEIAKKYPHTKIGVLTGTKHDIGALSSLNLAFLLKKPVDPAKFEQEVHNALR